MNRLVVLCVIVGFVAGDRLSSGYGPPNGRTNGGNGNGLSNGYSAPSNGGFNGGSNGYGNGGGFNGNGGYGQSAAESQLVELAASLPGGGVPGEDFPVFSEVPETSFQCADQSVSGYYADTEAQCQVFHICQLRESGSVQQDSFLCPNGTIFNQQYLVCDWWFNFDCNNAQDFYSVNELIGQETSNGGYGSASTNNGAYAAPAANGNGRNGRNGNGYSNGNGRNGNGNGRNGNGRNGNGRNGNGLNGGYSAPTANGNGNGLSSGYAAPATNGNNGFSNGNGQNNGYGGF